MSNMDPRCERTCSQKITNSCYLQDTRHVTHLINTCWTPLCATNTNSPLNDDNGVLLHTRCANDKSP